VAHEEAGYFVSPHGWSKALEGLVTAPGSVLSPQDPTAGAPVRLLRDVWLAAPPSAGGEGTKRILDLCAGLGTKTMHLARAFPQATVVATDLDSRKLQTLRERAALLGLANILPAPLTAFAPGVAPEKRPVEARDFHAVLLDVPCSNTGVLGRRPQARWRWLERDAAGLSKIQSALLAQSADLLTADGVIVYSTCSIDPAENQHRIREFLAGHATAFALVREQVSLPVLSDDPRQQRDGGYVALLRKT